MINYQFEPIGHADPSYAEAIAYSLPAYDAAPLRHLRQAFPTLIGAFRHGQHVGVCGYHSGRGGLMLEQFMSEPADQCLESHGEPQVPRDRIVELGAYRVRQPALTPLFAAQIHRLLVDLGYTHALALSLRPTHSLEAWARERTALSGDDGRSDSNTTLEASVIRLIQRP